MASEVQIYNRALQRVGATRVVSVDDANKNARACKAVYEPLRDALLRAHPWSFAIRRASLAADADAPAFDFDLQYSWPTDAVRILFPKDNTVDWVVEGRKILTNWTAPLEIRYLAKITDPNTMDPLFREALACTMASEICEELTQSNAKQDRIRMALNGILAEARRTNAIERLPVEPPTDSWDAARE